MAETEGDGFLDRFARNVGRYASARAVFGEAVEREGITIIPVARVWYGFGGGRALPSEDESRVGGGGGVSATPVGYIEVRNGESRFRPIGMSATTKVGLAAGAFLAWLWLRR